jgi:hypothetical protein
MLQSQLAGTQKKRFDEVMILAQMFITIPEFAVAYRHALKQIDKQCLKFCITLLDHQLYGNEYESAIVIFLAV